MREDASAWKMRCDEADQNRGVRSCSPSGVIAGAVRAWSIAAALVVAIAAAIASSAAPWTVRPG